MASVNKLSVKQQDKLNKLLLKGHGLTETSKMTNIPYSLVQSVRSRLVKAGVLKPLYKTTSKKRLNKSNPAVPEVQSDMTSVDTIPAFSLFVNGTQIDLKNVKSVFISPELVDVKY